MHGAILTLLLALSCASTTEPFGVGHQLPVLALQDQHGKSHPIDASVRVIVFSRDELKQFEMRQRFAAHDAKIRYFIGDVRDERRLQRAFSGVELSAPAINSA